LTQTPEHSGRAERLANLPLKAFNAMSEEEVQNMLSEYSGLRWLAEEVHAIVKYPDYRFSTGDGRTFGLFQHGENILRLLQNQSVPIDWRNKEGIQQIRDLAGIIFELGADDRPFFFNDATDLAIAWAELHVECGVEPTEDEYINYLEIHLPNLRGGEKDDAQA
jgi:hypothetical protein